MTLAERPKQDHRRGESPTARYGFATGPRWVVLHLVVLVMVALFGVAGFWQLHRLDERHRKSRVIERALAAPALDLNRHRYTGTQARRAKVTGFYDNLFEVILRNRSLDDESGNNVLTPLVIGGGRAVLVDRGWVPIDEDEAPVMRALPPTVRTTVEGLMLPPEPKRPLAPDDPAQGTLHAVNRINPARLNEQLPYELEPGYLLLAAQSPKQPGRLPVVVPPPELGNGPHLAYAVQWFLFMPTALAVYAALLRRESRKPSRAS